MNVEIILGLLLCCAPCADAAVNFDQGVDLKAAIEQAAASDIQVPNARFPMLTDLTRDCKKITFTQNDPLVSPEVSLVSYETSQDCQNMGYPAGQICFPTSRTYHETPKITITAPREFKPDQKEVFEVPLGFFPEPHAGFHRVQLLGEPAPRQLRADPFCSRQDHGCFQGRRRQLPPVDGQQL